MISLKAYIESKFRNLPGFDDPSHPAHALYNAEMLNMMLNPENVGVPVSQQFPVILPWVYRPDQPPVGIGNRQGTSIGSIIVIANQFYEYRPLSPDILTSLPLAFTIDANNGSNQTILAHIKELMQQGVVERAPMEQELARQTKLKEDLTATLLALNMAKSLSQECAKNAFDNLSLPDAFKHAILDVFMPMQEKILEKYANELYYCNVAIRIYNQITGATNTFTSADTIYSGSSEFRARFPETQPATPPGARPYYTGSAEEAKKILDKEKVNAQTDRDNITKAIKTIRDSIENVEKDPNLSDAQKKELTDKLKTTETNLVAANHHLENLINTINTTVFAPPGTSPAGTFQISTIGANPVWGSAALARITDREYDAINGTRGFPDPNNPNLQGGLKVIANQLNTDRTDYSSMTDQAQLELQNAMTKVQQEWTIVATALQLLNQMYMTVARGIKGG